MSRGTPALLSRAQHLVRYSTETSQSPIRLKFILPESKTGQPEYHVFPHIDGIRQWVKTYGGTVHTISSSGDKIMIFTKDYDKLKPEETYYIDSPENSVKYESLNRKIQGKGNTVAEWDGIFQTEWGIIFLECKHSMSAVIAVISNLS
jgi:hypothetical protein